MWKILILLLIIPFECYSQTKFYNDSTVAEVLSEETIKIGVNILNSAKAGKVEVYRTDSLDKTFLLSDFNREIKANEINGLAAIFKLTSDVEKASRTMDLVAFAPLYNPVISGIELPQMPFFYIMYADIEKVVSEKDKKLLNILSNLLFSTHNFQNEFKIGDVAKRQKQDIDNFVCRRISENINQSGYQVVLSKENLKNFGQSFIENINISFENAIVSKPNWKYNFQNIFEDINLSKQYELKSWKTKTSFCETVTVINPNDPYDVADTIVCTELDFYIFNKLILTKSAIGVGFDAKNFGDVPILVFTQRLNPNIKLPNWQEFILDNYL